jgi:hypothetical protein
MERKGRRGKEEGDGKKEMGRMGVRQGQMGTWNETEGGRGE